MGLLFTPKSVLARPGADILRYMILIQSNFTKTQKEAMVPPHGMTDYFSRKTMAFGANGFGLHTGQSAKYELR